MVTRQYCGQMYLNFVFLLVFILLRKSICVKDVMCRWCEVYVP